MIEDEHSRRVVCREERVGEEGTLNKYRDKDEDGWMDGCTSKLREKRTD